MKIQRVYFVEDFLNVHKLRCEVFGIKSINPDEDYWTNMFNNGKILCYKYTDENDKPIAGAYVSSSLGYLYIEQLFVDKDYQEIGLKLGRRLLSDILDRKEEVEKYFDKQMEWSCIAPIDEKSRSLYRKAGYHGRNAMDEMIRRI